MKDIIRFFRWVITLCVVVTVAINAWVVGSTHQQITHEAANLPDGAVALVLGTSKRTADGGDNPYFAFRMQAAIELYHQGKVKHFLLSGHNPSRYYNEPLDMKQALVKGGVPEEAITEDPEGLRTYESIRRCKEVYGYEEVTIITQQFHGYRALFLSNALGLRAVSYVATNAPTERAFPLLVREYFARIKAVIDLYIQPPQTVAPKEEHEASLGLRPALKVSRENTVPGFAIHCLS